MKNLDEYVNSPVNEESNKGWDKSVVKDLITLLTTAEKLKDEIESGKRGTFTGCTYYKSLGQYVYNLAKDLEEQSEYLKDF